ncbi:MAG: alpha/beta fold hydrolase [Alphaproteobacteria bacterium]|nr:alpha/beta fold hydrolase [Alphaproteobacteria bacterium]
MRKQDDADRLSVDAQAPGLVAHLQGSKPPAPAWFNANMAQAPEELRIESDGVEIEVLAWGERGRPGLLLLHGNGAHAGWWRPLAPFFTDRFRVAAMSWSGMGGSDWRPRYATDVFAREAVAAARVAGLMEGPVKPRLAAHSFGGFMALHVATLFPDVFSSALLLDCGVRPPGTEWEGPPRRTRPNRIYPTFEAALARFRLAPPQECDTLYYVDAIARESLREAPLPDGEGKGWTWKFDPFVMEHLAFEEIAPRLAAIPIPLALMWGDRSYLCTPEINAYMRETSPKGTPAIAIPDAAHHLMLDQPIATVAAINALFAAWG